MKINFSRKIKKFDISGCAGCSGFHMDLEFEQLTKREQVLSSENAQFFTDIPELLWTRCPANRIPIFIAITEQNQYHARFLYGGTSIP